MSPSTLEQLTTARETMNGQGAMDAIGISQEALGQLVEVVETHELGATAKAVLIYVRGMLQRTGQQFSDVSRDQETISEWKKGLPASSSVDRSIPLAAVMQEHLPDERPRTIIDLGAGRAHASRMFLEPEQLDDPFFSENNPAAPWKDRVAWAPSKMPNIARVVAVDNREATWNEASQVYFDKDGNPTPEVAVMEALEAKGDHNGRLVSVQRDIRRLDADTIRSNINEGEAPPVIFLNNILYAVSAEVRAEIKATVSKLAEELGATILQMEGWDVFEDRKPEVTLPGKDKALGLPAFVRMGTNFDAMKVVAKLDGSTGKPFVLVKQDDSEVFINSVGEEEVLEAA